MPNVWVYIDGFNLYNGCIKPNNCRWLNLFTFAARLMPHDSVGKVKYFTAAVQPRPNDPGQPFRQQAYWNALRTVPQIEIIQGHFLTKETWMPEAASIRAMRVQVAAGVNVVGQRPAMVEVVKTEEKGTDVNLAAHLVHDAHMNRFDTAVVISNDSDLTEAIRIVRREVGKVIGIYTPHQNTPSHELQSTASFFRRIAPRLLRASLFPDPVVAGTNRIAKPVGW